MYLHIGKDILIKKETIVGIFDYETLKKEKNFKQTLEKINVIEDISEGNQKTFIIVKENENSKGYISNISSVTLAKRNKN